MRPTSLEQLLASNGVPFAIVANVVTGETYRVGDPTGFGFDDLVNSLFADFDCVLATYRSVQGQLLPRMWSQGDVECVICRPTSDVLIGLFCKTERSPLEHFRWAKDLDAELSAIWASGVEPESGSDC